MSQVFPIVLWLLGIPAAFAASVILAITLRSAMWKMEGAITQFHNWLNNSQIITARRTLQKEDEELFTEWLNSLTASGASSTALDDNLVRAQQQSDLIRILVEEEIPKAVMRCVDVHRQTAEVTGAHHYIEVAFEPDCHAWRGRVVWLLSHAVQFIHDYPLRQEDPRLAHNALLLRRRALPTCQRCPFIQQLVSQAPKLCPTAELIARSKT